MKVEIVGHDRRPEDANRHEQRARRQAGPQARDHPQEIGLSLEHLDQETTADGRHQHQNHGFQLPHTPALKVQERKRVKGRDQTAPEQGQAKEQLERDDGAQHLGQVTRGDGHLGQNPEDQVHPGGILGPAGLRQVMTRNHPQPCGKGLEENRHQIGHQKHPD